MARLRDLVNVNINQDTIKIQGVDIPVLFSFKAFPFLEQAYGKPYHIFEKDINKMLEKKNVTMGRNESKLMNALIYAMVRAGGTECTPKELEASIPLTDLPNIFQAALNIFNNQYFQATDSQKLKQEKK